MTFDEFVEAKRARESAHVRVTWRRVSPDTGGGWSGLGPGRQLVYVAGRDDLSNWYRFGRVVNGARVCEGTADTLAEAKAAAAALLEAKP